MLTPDQKRLLSDLRHSNYGKVLSAYLEEKYKDIGDITTISGDNIAEETLGRKYALKVLKEIFSFMEEKRSVEKGKNQYT
jgi:hypothetical protein